MDARQNVNSYTLGPKILFLKSHKLYLNFTLQNNRCAVVYHVNHTQKYIHKCFALVEKKKHVLFVFWINGNRLAILLQYLYLPMF